MIGVVVILSLLLLGWVAGSAAEKAHLARLDSDEAELRGVLVTDLKSMPSANAAAGAAMVHGEVVIANDYFKMFAASLRNVFGGEVRSYESLVERGRRDALVRMQRDAVARGFDAVANYRVEMSIVAAQTLAIVAWGTAYRRDG